MSTLEKKLSRRQFMRGAATGAAAVAGMSALGAAAQETMPACPITELPETWDKEADVIVVGTGGAGLAAAVSAAEAGASVLVLQKMPAIAACNTAISGGVINAYTSKADLETKEGVEDSADLHFEDTIKGGDMVGDPELVRILVENAPAAVDWLAEYGWEEMGNLVWMGGASVPRAHAGVGMAGSPIINALIAGTEQFEDQIEVMLETKAVQLYMDGGRVVGVKAEQEGEEVHLKAVKAVVMATGGFGLNAAMVAAEQPTLAEMLSTNFKGTSTGEGLQMCQAIGAGVRGMAYIQAFPTCHPLTGALNTPATISNEAGPGILVNVEGKRFVEEKERRDVRRIAVSNQTGGYVFAIFDDAMLQRDISSQGGGWANDMLAMLEDGYENDYAWKAETPEELAEAAGIDPEAFVETVEKWNSFVENAEDTDFHRRDLPTGVGMKLETAPFYAFKTTPAIHHTMGGLWINEKAQVKDIHGEVIPGLYAAGEVTGGIHGTNRLGGNALADILVFGRIAGTNAAAEEPAA